MSELTPEKSRQDLQQEILSFIKDESSPPTQNSIHDVVSETLSYFPEQAHTFKETMIYADEIEGKKGLWQTIVHPNKRIEHLGTGRTYSAEEIMRTATIILQLRGLHSYAKTEFYTNPSHVRAFLNARKKAPADREWFENTVAKVGDVMNVTADDIVLLETYLEGHVKSNELHSQAWELEQRAKALRELAQETKLKPIHKIESTYPRQVKE